MFQYLIPALPVAAGMRRRQIAGIKRQIRMRDNRFDAVGFESCGLQRFRAVVDLRIFEVAARNTSDTTHSAAGIDA
jgi:hypothetical protein